MVFSEPSVVHVSSSPTDLCFLAVIGAGGFWGVLLFAVLFGIFFPPNQRALNYFFGGKTHTAVEKRKPCLRFHSIDQSFFMHQARGTCLSKGCVI